MAEVILGISQTEAVLFAALIGVFGALAGLVVERFLRSFGWLWCEPSDWELKFMGSRDAYGGAAEVGPENPNAASVEYSVTLDLYNGKEVPVGLRDVSIVFTHDGGELANTPYSASSRRIEFAGSAPTYATVPVVNLRPRQWVNLGLLGVVDDVEAMKGWRKAEFVGQRQRRGLLTSKTYRATIATR